MTGMSFSSAGAVPRLSVLSRSTNRWRTGNTLPLAVYSTFAHSVHPDRPAEAYLPARPARERPAKAAKSEA